MKECKTCAFRDPKQNICFRHSSSNRVLNVKETDFCSWHSTIITRCEICKNPILPENLIFEKLTENKFFGICPICQAYLFKCKTCQKGTYCAFKQDSSVELPLTVQKQIQSDNSILHITTIKNPARIEATCKAKKCPCFDGTNCRRETDEMSCQNYELPSEISSS